MSGLPEWVDNPALAGAWSQIRARFEAAGLEPRGRVTLRLDDRGQRHALGALLGRTVTASTVRVDLAALDQRLRHRCDAGGLAAVLAVLHGRPPQNRPARRAEQEDAREHPLRLAVELAAAPWATHWVAELRRTGLLTNRPGATRVVEDAATVLRVLTGAGDPLRPRSRVELGASLLGDAHALDRDRLLHQVVLRGLAAAAGTGVPTGARDVEQLWARFGVEPDLLSRTCLVWRLRPAGDGATSRRLGKAADAGDPIHLTPWDLRRIGRFSSSGRVLVCENPRVVEALAERDVAGWAAVCTAGEPNLVVDAVLAALVESGADLRYHGDFDWPGIAIANRVTERHRARPWRMSAQDYLAAVRSDGPPLLGRAVEPLWDGELGAAMRNHARAVHEESVLAGLLA